MQYNPDFKNSLKKLIADLYCIPPFRLILRFMYLFQLRTIVFILKNTRWFTAIILRRQAVLYDMHAGDSDFDLTCVLKQACVDYKERIVINWAKIHKIIKLLFPAVGETWLIEEEQLPEHLKLMCFDYGDINNLNFLYKNRGFNLAPVYNCFTKGAILRAFFVFKGLLIRAMFLTNETLPLSKRLFNRDFFKVISKINWCLEYAQSSKPFHLDYRNYSSKNLYVYTWQDKLDQFFLTIDRIKNIPFREDSENLKVKIIGNELFSNSEIDSLSLRFNALYMENSAIIDSIELTRYRMSKTEKMIIIILKIDDFASYEKILSHLHNNICNFSLSQRDYNPIYPLVLDRRILNIFRKNDPFFDICYDYSNYNLFKKTYNNLGTTTRSISLNMVKLELMQSLVITYSHLMRKGDPFEFVDHIVGKLVNYGNMVKNNELMVSLQDIEKKLALPLFNARQTKIFGLYNMNRHNELRKMKIADVYKIFSGVIEESIDRFEHFLIKSSLRTRFDGISTDRRGNK